MHKATVIGKGQVTLPQSVRAQLGIEAGDQLLFEVEDNALRERVIHGRGIYALFNSLSGVDAYVGEEAEARALREGFGKDQP